MPAPSRIEEAMRQFKDDIEYFTNDQIQEFSGWAIWWDGRAMSAWRLDAMRRLYQARRENGLAVRRADDDPPAVHERMTRLQGFQKEGLLSGHIYDAIRRDVQKRIEREELLQQREKRERAPRVVEPPPPPSPSVWSRLRKPEL